MEYLMLFSGAVFLAQQYQKSQQLNQLNANNQQYFVQDSDAADTEDVYAKQFAEENIQEEVLDRGLQLHDDFTIEENYPEHPYFNPYLQYNTFRYETPVQREFWQNPYTS
jgi:hypothetical protein